MDLRCGGHSILTARRPENRKILLTDNGGLRSVYFGDSESQTPRSGAFDAGGPGAASSDVGPAGARACAEGSAVSRLQRCGARAFGKVRLPRTSDAKRAGPQDEKHHRCHPSCLRRARVPQLFARVSAVGFVRGRGERRPGVAGVARLWMRRCGGFAATPRSGARGLRDGLAALARAALWRRVLSNLRGRAEHHWLRAVRRAKEALGGGATRCFGAQGLGVFWGAGARDSGAGIAENARFGARPGPQVRGDCVGAPWGRASRRDFSLCFGAWAWVRLPWFGERAHGDADCPAGPKSVGGGWFHERKRRFGVGAASSFGARGSRGFAAAGDARR